MRKVTEVEVLKDYRLELKFDDGKGGVVNLSAGVGNGVFAVWGDYAKFPQVRIGETGELACNDQIDLCLDSLGLQEPCGIAQRIFFLR
jgi:hypothetical protein